MVSPSGVGGGPAFTKGAGLPLFQINSGGWPRNAFVGPKDLPGEPGMTSQQGRQPWNNTLEHTARGRNFTGSRSTCKCGPFFWQGGSISDVTSRRATHKIPLSSLQGFPSSFLETWPKGLSETEVGDSGKLAARMAWVQIQLHPTSCPLGSYREENRDPFYS